MERPWGDAGRCRRGPGRKRPGLLVFGKERRTRKTGAATRGAPDSCRCAERSGEATHDRRRPCRERRWPGRRGGDWLAVQPPQVPDRRRRHRRGGGDRRARRRRPLPRRARARRCHCPGRAGAAHPHRALQQLRRRLRAPRPRRRRQGEARRGRALRQDEHRRSTDPGGVPAAHLPARRLAAREPLQRRAHQVPVQAGRRARLGKVGAHQLGRGDHHDRRQPQEGAGQVRQGLGLDRAVHGLA